MLQISLPELFETAIRSALLGVHTAMPAKVLTYYPASQTVDVQPLVKRTLFTADGGKVFESLPAIPAVPVAWPRGAGYMITIPLAPGDFVWLMFAESSTSEVRATGQESEPLDSRRHGLAYPVAIPGGVPDPSPLADAPSAGLTMGKDGGDAQVRITDTTILLGKSAANFVALSNLVDSAVATIINAFNTHIHTSGGPGSPTTIPLAPMSSPPSSAATLVKAK